MRLTIGGCEINGHGEVNLGSENTKERWLLNINLLFLSLSRSHTLTHTHTLTFGQLNHLKVMNCRHDQINVINIWEYKASSSNHLNELPRSKCKHLLQTLLWAKCQITGRCWTSRTVLVFLCYADMPKMLTSEKHEGLSRVVKLIFWSIWLRQIMCF